jgi:hypothetical protein
MSDRIIYILCHDDTSEQIAHTNFDKYNWARVYRIPIERQNHLMESVMYSTELMSVYDEWKDKKYVGTLSYKLGDRLRLDPPCYPRGMDGYDNIIQNSHSSLPSVYGFRVYRHSDVDSLPGLRTILRDTCKKIGFDINRNQGIKFNLKSRKIEKISYLDTMAFIFHNYWMTTPAIMVDYIKFFNNVWMPALETHPDIWKDSSYKYSVSYSTSLTSKQRMLMLTNGKTDYPPFHAYANERLPTLFCLMKGIKIVVPLHD